MLVILNNKCNFNKSDFDLYQRDLINIKSNHQMILCPSNLYLSKFNLPNFLLGAQNVSPYGNGPYTGEISSEQLKSLDVKYTIVGHSERRTYFKETNAEIKEKLNNLLNNDIIPILCIGEEDRVNTKLCIKEQLEVIKNLKNNNKIIIAYEPIWAIGTGSIPTLDEIENVVSIIKESFPNNYIVYGGSVDENNINKLKSNLIDGYLLGNLSLYPKKIQLFLNNLDN